MTDPPPRRYGLIAAVAAIVIVLDQLTKWWAVNALQDEPIAVVWTLQLNLARNTGAAFSVGRGSDLIRFLPLLVLVAVIIFVARSKTPITRPSAVAVGMIIGGALGNLVDRALRTNGGAFFSGGVVDFIDFQWWPVFNVADMNVVVGGLLLVALNLRAPHDEPDEPADAGAPDQPREVESE